MTFSIKGRKVSGQGDASTNLSVLLPLLNPWSPGIERYHPGTVNIALDRPLKKNEADVWTSRIEWQPIAMKGGAGPRNEIFGLTAGQVEFPPDPVRLRGMIISSEGAFSTYDPFTVEVIVERYVDKVGTECLVFVDARDRVEAPPDLGTHFSPPVRF